MPIASSLEVVTAVGQVYFWPKQSLPAVELSMTDLRILRFPDPRLKMRCATIVEFGGELKTFSEDLLQAMRTAPGVGITAAHVGVLTRLVIIELDKTSGALTYVNPEITWASQETGRHTEGSVCMPGATEDVERPLRIRFRYQDLMGLWHEEEAEGFLAVCIQHEIDQLDGIFWLQRLSRLKCDRLVRKWERTGA